MHAIPPYAMVIHKLNHHHEKYIHSINKNMKLTIKINFKDNVFAIMPVMGHSQVPLQCVPFGENPFCLLMFHAISANYSL